jgi:hypothetical protein
LYLERLGLSSVEGFFSDEPELEAANLSSRVWADEDEESSSQSASGLRVHLHCFFQF